MKKTAYAILLFTQLLICSVVALAAEPRQNITPEKKTESKPVEAAPTSFPYHPIGSWAGKRFIFLPKPKSSESGTYEDFSRPITHQKYAGRVARVVSADDSGARAYIEFEMEDDGERLRVFTVASKESVRGMALVDDIENARKQWAGKTLWSKLLMISSYDEQSGAITMTQVKKFGPLKVVEVVPGWDEEKPVRFKLETPDGKQGFVDLNLSGTNVHKEARHMSRFEDHLLAEDPRLKYKWSRDVWQSIEKGQVYVGMTEEQVKMSWGEPDKVTRTAAGEVWTYQSGALVFRKGVMAGTQ
ncbi:MAG TPA: hypothetical protein VJ810_08500 [Blastocatellia bacterium]|nr:hypothetical protein [Blastocatellia bacterium]